METTSHIGNARQHLHWIATVDERHATLFSCTMVPGKRWHIEKKNSTQNTWENSHEMHRPNTLGGGSKTNSVQHSGSFGHEKDEENLRFAREVGTWLKDAAKKHASEHICIFAASRFLGLLRKEMGSHDGRIDLHECELTHLQPQELSVHPTVLAALDRLNIAASK
ncbi:MAG: host attachment protein [Planctomycetes bacterium]|nr:host attachment protein [Planctomycetota bacterium]